MAASLTRLVAGLFVVFVRLCGCGTAASLSLSELAAGCSLGAAQQ